MAIVQQHIIKSQVLEIEMYDPAKAKDQQNELSLLYHKHILPLLDEVCTEFSSANELIQIDQLEINLGRFQLEQFYPDNTLKLKSLLRESLAKKIQPIKNGQQINGVKIKTIHPLSLSSSNRNVKEALNHYLMFGTIPWWVKRNNFNIKSQLTKTIQDKSFFSSSNPVLKNPIAITRIVNLLTEEELLDAIKNGYPDKIQAINQFRRSWLNWLSTKINSIKNLEAVSYTHLTLPTICSV